MANGKRGKKPTTSMENFLQDVARESAAAQGMAARPDRDLRTAGWAKPLRDPQNPWMLELAIQMVWFARNNDRLVDNSWDYDLFSQALQKEDLSLPDGMTIEKAVDEVQAILRKVGSRKPKHRGGRDDPSIPEDAGWYELNVGRPLHQKRTRLDVGAQAIDAPFRDGAGSSPAFEARAGGANYYDTLDTSMPEHRVVLHTDLERLEVLAGKNCHGTGRALQSTALSAGQTKKLSRERDGWASVGELCALILEETGRDSQQIDDVLSALSDPDAAQMLAGEPGLKANPLLCEAVQKAAPQRLDDGAFYGEVAALLLRHVMGSGEDR